MKFERGNSKRGWKMFKDDLRGKRFERLIAVKPEYNPKMGWSWGCLCDCGNYVLVKRDHLTSAHTKSCGCLSREKTSERMLTHGQTNTRVYSIWAGMKNRCQNPNLKSYHYYGGRGISVCEEWEHSFESFYEWAMTNGYKKKLTIDRIDVNGNYEPNNCRWATSREQANNRRSNYSVTFNGETTTLAEFSRKYGFNYSTLISRIMAGNAASIRVGGQPVKIEKGIKA